MSAGSHGINTKHRTQAFTCSGPTRKTTELPRATSNDAASIIRGTFYHSPIPLHRLGDVTARRLILIVCRSPRGRIRLNQKAFRLVYTTTRFTNRSLETGMSAIDRDARSDAGAPEEWKPQRKELLIMFSLAFISLMVALDATILVTVLPVS
jgi:hypothetical protein